MLSINISTPFSIMNQLKDKFKQRRLALDLTQEGLSSKSEVSLGSIKRFESTGHISLDSLLKISLVLDCLDDFQLIANPKQKPIFSLDDILKPDKKPVKKRGSIK
jgi:transcriptional regulator with XRE-family HTH domain